MGKNGNVSTGPSSSGSESLRASIDADQVIATICSRRSVRDGFDGEPIEPEIIAGILQCGLAAPSSKNAQPWRLHVVENRQTLDLIATAAQSAENRESYVPRNPATGMPRTEWQSTVWESAEVLRSASMGIFIENCGTFSGGRSVLTSASPERYAGSIVGYTFEVLGIGTAIENMWIAAIALGLQGAFMGDLLIVEELISGLLSIDGDLVGVLALGRSSEPPSPNRMVYEVEGSDLVVRHGRSTA